MPIMVRKRGGKFRLVEPSGRVVMRNGAAVDGGGHASELAANKQRTAINLSKKRRRRA
jgi:hypothetical protein